MGCRKECSILPPNAMGLGNESVLPPSLVEKTQLLRRKQL